VRLLGVSVSELARSGEAKQSELFANEDRSQRLRAALDRVRDRLGEASVVPLGTLVHRRRLSHVPFGMPQARTPVSRKPDASLGAPAARPGRSARRGRDSGDPP